MPQSPLRRIILQPFRFTRRISALLFVWLILIVYLWYRLSRRESFFWDERNSLQIILTSCSYPASLNIEAPYFDSRYHFITNICVVQPRALQSGESWPQHSKLTYVSRDVHQPHSEIAALHICHSHSLPHDFHLLLSCDADFQLPFMDWLWKLFYPFTMSGGKISYVGCPVVTPYRNSSQYVYVSRGLHLARNFLGQLYSYEDGEDLPLRFVTIPATDSYSPVIAPSPHCALVSDRVWRTSLAVASHSVAVEKKALMKAVVKLRFLTQYGKLVFVAIQDSLSSSTAQSEIASNAAGLSRQFLSTCNQILTQFSTPNGWNPICTDPYLLSELKKDHEASWNAVSSDDERSFHVHRKLTERLAPMRKILQGVHASRDDKDRQLELEVAGVVRDLKNELYVLWLEFKVNVYNLTNACGSPSNILLESALTAWRKWSFVAKLANEAVVEIRHPSSIGGILPQPVSNIEGAAEMFAKQYGLASLDSRHLSVTWIGDCCSCCGMSNEIAGLIVPLSKYVEVRSNMDSRCHCSMPRHYKNQLNLLSTENIEYFCSWDPKRELSIWIHHLRPTLISPYSHCPKEASVIHINRLLYELSPLPPSWLHSFSPFKEIWVPSHFVGNLAIQAGIAPRRIKVIPEPLDTNFFDPDRVERINEAEARKWRHVSLNKARVLETHLLLPDGFKFLSVFKWEGRKGPEILIEAFLDAFFVDEKREGNARPTATLIILSFYFSPAGTIKDPRDPKYIVNEIEEIQKSVMKKKGYGAVKDEELPGIVVITQKISELEVVHVE